MDRTTDLTIPQIQAIYRAILPKSTTTKIKEYRYPTGIKTSEKTM